MKKKVDTGLMPMIIFVMDVFQTYMDDIDNIMKTKYKSIRIHPTIKSRGLSAMPSCKKCAYKTWDRKCLKCGTLFSSEGDQYCPTCYEDDDKEYKRWVDLWGED